MLTSSFLIAISFELLFLFLIYKMMDFSAICLIPFYGKSNEWLTWSEKFLAKAKRYDFKVIFWKDQLFSRLMRLLMLNWNKKRIK
jgi:hypothetical protein